MVVLGKEASAVGVNIHKTVITADPRYEISRYSLWTVFILRSDISLAGKLLFTEKWLMEETLGKQLLKISEVLTISVRS